MKTADAVIVGAGIVGAACAGALAEEGLRVIVVESGAAGGGATAAGMGHIVAMDDSGEQWALTSYSRDLWRRLSPLLPPEAAYDPCGTIWVASGQEEMDAARRKADFFAEHGARAEVLDAHSLKEAEPNLRAGLAGVVLIPDDCVVYPPSVAQWLIHRARGRGACIRTGIPVAEIGKGGVRLEDGSHIAAGWTVCATGSWARTLVPSLEIHPRKGHLAITDRYPGFLQRQVMELGYSSSAHGSQRESVAFNVQPRTTGQVLIGSSRQFGETSGSVDRAMLARMLGRAIEYMPGLAALDVIRVWTGFRAATPDRLPLIGPCPDREGVYLATGHEGLGSTTSLATARLLADQILKRRPAIPVEPYLPARFGAAHE